MAGSLCTDTSGDLHPCSTLQVLRTTALSPNTEGPGDPLLSPPQADATVGGAASLPTWGRAGRGWIEAGTAIPPPCDPHVWGLTGAISSETQQTRAAEGRAALPNASVLFFVFCVCVVSPVKWKWSSESAQPLPAHADAGTATSPRHAPLGRLS